MYLSSYKKFNKNPSTNYHPDLEDEIWDGVISIDLYQPTGPEWEAFSQAVINRSQDDIWAPYISQPLNTSSVDHFAGNLYYNLSFCVHCLQIHLAIYTFRRLPEHW